MVPTPMAVHFLKAPTSGASLDNAKPNSGVVPAEVSHHLRCGLAGCLPSFPSWLMTTPPRSFLLPLGHRSFAPCTPCLLLIHYPTIPKVASSTFGNGHVRGKLRQLSGSAHFWEDLWRDQMRSGAPCSMRQGSLASKYRYNDRL